ncbi:MULTISPECIES: hypothetical protein [Cellulomonas]|uniref:CheW protein n=1 Tax=Cellulomonas gilvus (strain ATCC 13127 / NRRL B-14078) TaxID=593907 RepID=F8A732_CELGA|nr:MULTISPECIES: hypothetical protein [Cellulomonas]AEI13519.1 CheW protein [Cellulomonas gilvus ATCC 13127]MCR6688732.1 chemotaxis protein CheW [Cellulomonas sp.]
MSALALTPSRPTPSSRAMRVRRFVEMVRFAPAPRFEGSAAHRWAFVGYVAGSMLAWMALGLAVSALLGALVS